MEKSAKMCSVVFNGDGTIEVNGINYLQGRVLFNGAIVFDNEAYIKNDAAIKAMEDLKKIGYDKGFKEGYDKGINSTQAAGNLTGLMDAIFGQPPCTKDCCDTEAQKAYEKGKADGVKETHKYYKYYQMYNKSAHKHHNRPGTTETVIIRSVQPKSFATVQSLFLELRHSSKGSSNTPTSPDTVFYPGDEIEITIKKRGGKVFMEQQTIQPSTGQKIDGVDLTPVVSSNIEAIGFKPYEKQKSAEVFGQLYIQFKGNKVYRYDDVPASFYKEFMVSYSKGKFFGAYRWKPVLSKYQQITQ
jgi:hypothetical protein